MGYGIPDDHHSGFPPGPYSFDPPIGLDNVFVHGEGEIKVDKNVTEGTKETNPKDAVGIKKWRQYSTVPMTVIWELGVAMLEGSRKYGRHNYRVSGVRGSVYVDAAKGHIDTWWEGEDIDPDSGLSHITKAIASLVVLRDAMIQDKFVDDRPPKTDMNKLRADLQGVVENIFERYPDAVDAYLEGDQYDT